ncbi:MAG: PTS sugar transporter subunit IIB [Erysipelotrichia bacterium]|jgi:PTS system ascorbate-specific IIB component|nr:PTS sugar transporter subunit IIB [Erysipelotrichia bacterium]
MLKIYTVCGAGVGTSMMLRLFTQQIMDQLNVDAVIDAVDVASVDPSSADWIITTSDIADVIRGADDKLIRIDNLTDKAALKEAILVKLG